MARSLASKTNVTAPGGSYPYGRVKDNDGSNNGTPVNENLLGDAMQFFEKLLADASITANEQPENSSNGFQYIQALDAFWRIIVQESTDLDNISKTGFFFANGALNRPSGENGLLLAQVLSSDFQTQLFLVLGNDRIFFRRKNLGVWGSWLELATTSSASDSAAGIAELATQAETNTGTDDARIVTPLKLTNKLRDSSAQATESARGTAEIATQTETNDGVDDTRFITPSKLANKTATESRTGVAEIATQAETNTGTDDARMVTPLKLAGKIADSSSQATESARGTAEIATQAETNTGSDDARFVTPLKLANSITAVGSVHSVKLLTKVVDIGDWNMDTDATKNVAHGFADVQKIRSMSVMIRNDAGDIMNHIDDEDGNGVMGSVQSIGTTNVSLLRKASPARFDSTSYDSTSYNRGWITFVYEV